MKTIHKFTCMINFKVKLDQIIHLFKNLRQITINDLPVGRSIDETLRLVQAFQFTDKCSEVCPAGWKPGDESIKPDPKKALDYFQKNN